MIHHLTLGSNPFLDAYLESDLLGKWIFLGLFALSICCWIILIYKGWIFYKVRNQAKSFQFFFRTHRLNPLGFDLSSHSSQHPFLQIYLSLKKHTLEILNKNRHFDKNKDNVSPYLSQADIEFIESHICATISLQTKYLEKNLYILSTIVSLAPFLGLLGTVWGILTTFSQLQTQGTGNTHQMVLGGLSLALATTVLGLIDAIPALIGYNYLKNDAKDFQTDMEYFSNELLASVELQYRQVDVKS